MNDKPRHKDAIERRAQALQEARRVLQAIVDGNREVYEGYREVYGIYIRTSGMLEELKPLFRLPDINPDGQIQVDDKFRRTVAAAAVDWLQQHPESKGSK